jgi:Sulfotransferase family
VIRLEAPIVIIGAGRSGSSLLHEVLNAHPAIHMLGEMEFAMPQIWRGVWEVSAAATARSRRLELARREVASEPDDRILARISALETQEREQAAGIIRDALDRLYRLSALPKTHWGFKEIWMPTQGPHSWRAYDALFPKATYVHIIRHPFLYARSVADWNRIPFTLETLHTQLSAWVDYLEASRQRAATGRYVAFTYEALVKNPRTVLAPLLAQQALAWDDACLSALKRKHVASERQSSFPAGARALLNQVADLPRLMAEFGYDMDKVTESANGQAAAPADVATSLGAGVWRLNAPFSAEGPRGWLAPLHFSKEFTALANLADDLANPRRSPLQLFEDGKPLGPPHSLHEQIRHAGMGRYSHWSLGHVLLFSTSDNTDPNRNGRTYTVALNSPPAGPRAGRQDGLRVDMVARA